MSLDILGGRCLGLGREHGADCTADNQTDIILSGVSNHLGIAVNILKGGFGSETNRGTHGNEAGVGRALDYGISADNQVLHACSADYAEQTCGYIGAGGRNAYLEVVYGMAFTIKYAGKGAACNHI